MTTSDCVGVVQSFDAQQGYGRILDREQRVFLVHYRDLVDASELKPGQNVRFSPLVHRKGNIARQVRRT